MTHDDERDLDAEYQAAMENYQRLKHREEMIRCRINALEEQQARRKQFRYGRWVLEKIKAGVIEEAAVLYDLRQIEERAKKRIR